MDKAKISKQMMVYSQEGDSCQDNDNEQEITIESENAGAGDYYVIKTERWAFDNIEEFVKLLKSIKLRKEGANNGTNK